MNNNNLTNRITIHFPLKCFTYAYSAPRQAQPPLRNQPNLSLPRPKQYLLAIWICFIALAGCGRMQKAETPVIDAGPVEPPGQIIAERLDAAHCSGRPERLQPELKRIASKLSGIMYKTPYRDYQLDCSGMFHRVLEELASTCPTPAYAYPDRQRFRTTRQLARWYHDRKQLTVVRDIESQSRLIRPGVVMFYGKHGKIYHNPSIQKLEKHGIGIEHMGVVVEVEKDAAGRVMNYHLFHGRRTGKPSATTTRHFRDWAAKGYTNSKDYQPLGNWKQQWVAIAPLIKPK